MDSSIIGPSLIDVFTALEYQDDKGLVTTNTADIESGRIFVWEEVSTKLEMDAAYFHGNVPVVYFKRFNEFNNDKLWKLHRSLWNHNRAPLLIAVLPNEVRIYNCFTPPTRTPDEFAVESSVLLKKEPSGSYESTCIQEKPVRIQTKRNNNREIRKDKTETV